MNQSLLVPFTLHGSLQSRADLLTLGLAVANILNGLVWLSIRPKPITAVRNPTFHIMLSFILGYL